MEQRPRQTVRIIKTKDGVNIACADLPKKGPTLVKASNWLTHLEYDWDSPCWRHWTQFLARHFHYIRYDERGCGMSQRDVEDVSPSRWIEDLTAVIDAVVPEGPMAILAISQ